MPAACRTFSIEMASEGAPEMLKAIVLTLAAGIVLAGSAGAQPLRVPTPDPGAAVLLVKHDKDEHGHGRKLGHYKHAWQGDDEDQDEDEDGDRGRRWSSAPPGFYAPDWYYAPPPYYAAPPPPYSDYGWPY